MRAALAAAMLFVFISGFVFVSGGFAAQDDVASRIERVEKGLLPAILLDGGPKWTLEERMRFHEVPGLAVAVIRDFEIDWAKGYGVIASGTDDPVSTETMFQAASITKPIGATVALWLVEHGELDLDTPVNDRLVSWKIPDNEFTKDEKVTLRRILTHTSGLTVHGFRGYDVAGGEAVPTIIEVLDGKEPSNSDPVRVESVPGTRFSYSGGGYTVMQLLIEDVTGKSLHALTRELVFEPLGMANSSLEKPLPDDLYAKISAGHKRDGTVIEGYWFLPAGSSCCGLWTTPEDLAKYAIELQKSLRGESNKILSAEMTSMMLSPDPVGGFGLGMGLTGSEPDIYFSHSGGNWGFKCILIAHKDKGYGAAIMTNSDRGPQLYQEVLRAIADVYGWEGFLPGRYATIDEYIGKIREFAGADPNDGRASEQALNMSGYEMLQSGQRREAIALLSLNAELRPKSANCWDSLAEAYLLSGDEAAALTHYEKALETLNKYPEENKQYTTLRENIERHLKELRK